MAESVGFSLEARPQNSDNYSLMNKVVFLILKEPSFSSDFELVFYTSGC